MEWQIHWGQKGNFAQTWERMAEMMEGELGDIIAYKNPREWPSWVREMPAWVQTRLHDIAIDLRMQDNAAEPDEIPGTPEPPEVLAPDSPEVFAPNTPEQGKSPDDVMEYIPETPPPRRPRGTRQDPMSID